LGLFNVSEHVLYIASHFLYLQNYIIMYQPSTQ